MLAECSLVKKNVVRLPSSNVLSLYQSYRPIGKGSKLT